MDSSKQGFADSKDGITLSLSPSVDPNLVVGPHTGGDGGMFGSDPLAGLDIPLLRDLPTEEELLSCLGEAGMLPDSCGGSSPVIPAFTHKHEGPPFLEISPDFPGSYILPHFSIPCESNENRSHTDTHSSLVPIPVTSEHRWNRQENAPAFSHKLRANSICMKRSYRGVSRHRLTQRWEASLWLKGKQLYLGGFNYQEDAARAYDLAALACKGSKACTNFHASEYKSQLEEIQSFSEEEVVAYIRRRSTAFSRGRSKYRGVSGQVGRWEARIGSFRGRKNVRDWIYRAAMSNTWGDEMFIVQVSFGVFETEEEAAQQYDRALVIEKGRSGSLVDRIHSH